MDLAAGGQRKPPSHVVVVGGGIAGLAAAWELRALCGAAVRVTVLESAPQLGGKLAVSAVAGVPVDAGAESMLARRREGLDLVAAVGLGDEIVYPAVSGAAVWSRGALRPLPTGQLMGIPGDLASLAASGVLSSEGLARATRERARPEGPGDVSIGSMVEMRLGREVVDRLVEPLLGGVYAGHADELSLDAALPQLSAALRREPSLTQAVRDLTPSADVARGPMFGSVQGGLGRFPAAVAQASGAEVRLGLPVRELSRTQLGWRLTFGSARAEQTIDADAVVLALPAAPAARLLRGCASAAAAELAAIEYASVAVVTLAVRASLATESLRGTGFLVPPVEGWLIKAATYASQKWAWLGAADPDVVLLRTSIGRFREEQDLQRDDADLVAAALADVTAATGVAGPLVDSRVTRWGGALPQYAVGHLARVARIRAAIATQPGLAVCGAAYDGVGIPACIASAQAAATQVAQALAAKGQWAHD